ncbi:DUF1697 domain-containing protein [Sphingobacterium cavernae]|uniref:DUF1697 domain-containing protein n=1 Tax=Sphingobacterium cavernae TaxID=2592657 RepID=UPI0012302076|nr:DUF1697 domain-containing protein [Sphingobacterium cavernae]
METFIILLRAVNVAGKNSIKMAELKSHLEKANFHYVKTYIQSGNIILQSDLSAPDIILKVQQIISQEFGLSVHVFVLNTDSLQHILHNNPFQNGEEGNRVFITLLDKKPDSSDLEKFARINISDEKYEIKDDVFYFYVPQGMANSKLSNPFIEQKLKVISTGRNLNTMLKLSELAYQLN